VHSRFVLDVADAVTGGRKFALNEIAPPVTWQLKPVSKAFWFHFRDGHFPSAE
jgi:hypothetical protein